MKKTEGAIKVDSTWGGAGKEGQRLKSQSRVGVVVLGALQTSVC